MPVSEAQKKASAKYLEKLDEIRIRMPKGKKDTIQAHAANQGESVNSFINRTIDQAIAQDTTETTPAAAGNTSEAGVVSLPSDTLKAAQEAAEAAGEAVPQFIARAVETQAQRDNAARKMKK